MAVILYLVLLLLLAVEVVVLVQMHKEQTVVLEAVVEVVLEAPED
jgi:hypothetical protein